MINKVNNSYEESSDINIFNYYDLKHLSANLLEILAINDI